MSGDILSKAADFYEKAGLSLENWKNKREPNSFDSKVRQEAINFAKNVSPTEASDLTLYYLGVESKLGLSISYRDRMMEEIGKVESAIAYQMVALGVILFWYTEKVVR